MPVILVCSLAFSITLSRETRQRRGLGREKERKYCVRETDSLFLATSLLLPSFLSNRYQTSLSLLWSSFSLTSLFLWERCEKCETGETEKRNWVSPYTWINSWRNEHQASFPVHCIHPSLSSLSLSVSLSLCLSLSVSVYPQTPFSVTISSFFSLSLFRKSWRGERQWECDKRERLERVTLLDVV